MRHKATFVLGAGLGYVLGTQAGQRQLTKVGLWARGVWEDPRIQSQVNDLEAFASEFARVRGAAIKARVSQKVKGSFSPFAEPYGSHMADDQPV